MEKWNKQNVMNGIGIMTKSCNLNKRENQKLKQIGCNWKVK